MSTEVIFQIKSLKPEDTLEIGKKLGKACKGGELFVLSSDLGGGKTTLTKGLAGGLASSDVVSSPSFAINNRYLCRGGIEISHYDFYRLNESGIVTYEMFEDLKSSNVITVIEWSGIIDDILPKERIVIVIDKDKDKESLRMINISCDEKLKYLIEALK